MKELVAKRYIKAIKSTSNIEAMKEMTDLFSVLAESFKNEKFTSIVNNPNVSIKDKSDILLDAVKTAKSEKIDNLIKLLVEHKRINIIPAIAAELRKDMAFSTKTYAGIIYSDSDIADKLILDLSNGLSKRFDATISLEAIKNDFNGIKVEVEDLGVEINFSKDRIDHQIIEHIVKAI